MIRKITAADVPAIKNLIDVSAKKNKVLPRSLNSIYEHMRDFFVYEENGKILGCAAFHVVWENLGEVRSVVVSEEARGRGAGKKLVEECAREAAELKVNKVFLLTEIPGFFEKLGFVQVDKSLLPHKIWSDCVDCVHFPDCCEVAMVKEIQG